MRSHAQTIRDSYAELVNASREVTSGRLQLAQDQAQVGLISTHSLLTMCHNLQATEPLELLHSPTLPLPVHSKKLHTSHSDCGLQMSSQQHQLVKEKPVFGKSDVNLEEPPHRRINEMQSALMYMAKTVSALRSEKNNYLQGNRELLSRNTLLVLVSPEA